jgi:uncharacterized membrane protein YphA (DoxX/SURF4 family)
MFPQGGPGLALFLLRLSVVASLAAIATHLPGLVLARFALAGIALASLCLAVGFVTPAMSAIAAVAAAVDIAAGPHGQGFIVSLILLLDAAALGLLGPGAYSIDARLFGRRVTVLPPLSDTDD